MQFWNFYLVFWTVAMHNWFSLHTVTKKTVQSNSLLHHFVQFRISFWCSTLLPCKTGQATSLLLSNSSIYLLLHHIVQYQCIFYEVSYIQTEPLLEVLSDLKMAWFLVSNGLLLMTRHSFCSFRKWQFTHATALSSTAKEGLYSHK